MTTPDEHGWRPRWRTDIFGTLMLRKFLADAKRDDESPLVQEVFRRVAAHQDAQRAANPSSGPVRP